MTNAILLALAPVFFVLLLGYGAGRFRVVENHHVDGLNTLVMSFALPASLFVATASASRGEMFAQAPLFVIFGGMMLVVYIAWYFYARARSNISSADASLQALTIAFPNLAGVGLPIALALIGPAGTVPVAVALAAGSIIISPLSLIVAEMNTSKANGAAHSRIWQILGALRRALTKPIVLAPALGILFSLIDVKIGPVVKICLMLIGQAAPGVALFLTGLILSSQPFRLDWNVASATGMANIVRPLLTTAIVFVLPIHSDIARIAILFAAAPSGFFGILFAVNYRLDSARLGSMVIASTALSVVTMAIAIGVLYR